MLLPNFLPVTWRCADARPWILLHSRTDSLQDAEQFNSLLRANTATDWSSESPLMETVKGVLEDLKWEFWIRGDFISRSLTHRVHFDSQNKERGCFFATRNIYICWGWCRAGRGEAHIASVWRFARAHLLLLITQCCVSPCSVKGASTGTLQEWHLVAIVAKVAPYW